MRLLFLSFLLFPAVLLQAQFQKKVTLQVNPLKQSSIEPVQVNPEFEFSSVSIAVPLGSNFEGSYIVADADTFWLKPDEHSAADSKLFSQLIIFESNQQEIYFFNRALNGPVTFHFLNAHTSAITPIEKPEKKNAACLEEPASISQEEWRAGLPAPDYDRIVQQVKNQIIHHSAGSNTDTAYTNVIRNIYLFHTESRGWSDIGYNYVIAQNGQLYKGRDPGNYEQDNVMGAHFCGSNTTTMGICMLGDYEKVNPTQASLKTLAQLLAWKAAKESINAYSVFNHLLNTSLKHISGHRDGCATLCPGENLYNSLEKVRTSVDSIHVSCDYNFELVVGVSNTEELGLPIRVNSTSKSIEIPSMENLPFMVRLIDVTGKVRIQKSHATTINYTGLKPGIYFLTIQTNSATRTIKLILR